MTRAIYSGSVRWAQGAITESDDFDSGATTAYDDIGADIESITITRGRSDPYQPIGAGTCTLRLRDPDGKYSVGYGASVLVGGASDGLGNLLPLRTLRVRGVHLSTTYQLFYGFFTRVSADPDGKTATIEASDLLSLLSRYGTVEVNTGGQGTVDGVVSVLVYGRTTNGATIISGATGSAFQGTPTGLVFPAGASTLAQLSDVMAVEQGLFYMRSDGHAQIMPRHWHDYPPRNVAQSTLTQAEIRLLSNGVAVDGIVNRATVTGRAEAVHEPTVAPTLSTPTGGELAAGDYTVGYTFVAGGGETILSPTATTTAALDDLVRVTALAPLPTGVTGVHWYMSHEPGSAELRSVGTNDGSTIDFPTAPTMGAGEPPSVADAVAAIPQTVEVAPFTTDAQADYGTLSSPYILTAAAALATASWIVGTRSAPQPAGYGADLDGDAGNTVMVAILSRDLHDRVSIDAIRVGSADYYILGITHSIDSARRHTCRWTLLRRRASGIGFVFGYSGFGEAAFA